LQLGRWDDAIAAYAAAAENPASRSLANRMIDRARSAAAAAVLAAARTAAPPPRSPPRSPPPRRGRAALSVNVAAAAAEVTPPPSASGSPSSRPSPMASPAGVEDARPYSREFGPPKKRCRPRSDEGARKAARA